VAASKVSELEPGNGLNAETGVYGDLIKAGIIDPVKVTRSALRNAASIASMILTTNTLVVEASRLGSPVIAGLPGPVVVDPPPRKPKPDLPDPPTGK